MAWLSLRSPVSGLCLLLVPASAFGQAKPVEFNRDIRPILANNCFVCHGPDNNLRKAKLRLDVATGANKIRGGTSVIAPGKSGESALFNRITSDEPTTHMPPRDSKKELTKAQIELIRRWIEQGGKYQEHWSLLPITRPELPKVSKLDWTRNPIDRFTLARLEEEKLSPSPEADRRTQLRRLSFDLIGLPPTPADLDAFEKDASAHAYEKVVDRLLSSPHFGERMAIQWLDLVRFADSAGYHSDNHRELWLYRDWVIDAFNKNMPFDRFSIEQLAGDLLPNAGWPEKIASGYNRLLQTTEEGGAQAKEYQAKYYADRVRNASTVWLGMTLGCTECHDHKYDPFRTKEFYQFQAFFADLQEASVGRQAQTPVPSPEQAAKLKSLDEQMAPLQKIMSATAPELEMAQAKWEAEMRESKFKGLPKEVAAVLGAEPSNRTEKQQQSLAKHFRDVTPLLAEPRDKLKALMKEKDELQKAIPTTLISTAGPPRTVKVLPRGNWLDDSGAVVQPETPAALPKLKAEKQRATRLDLANWIVSPDNPFTARVFVNRLWSLYFGQGIVKTQDDFGAQGAWPTHPELLDWLAAEFRDSGWNVKHIIKLMVTSNTYRQSSKATEALRQRDPYNQLLARQARFRFDAELVRDNALAVSGLLSRKIGGPSVKPYQPAGYWAYLNFPTREWQKDAGENLYRRGLYTYWQRTFPHPSLLAFDASTREECTVDRPRSNTPQQALVLLNDPTYVEAARGFAEKIIHSGKSPNERIDYAFREALTRHADVEEIKLLSSLAEKHLAHYQNDVRAAEAYLRVGDRPVPADIAAPELAAWTNVARVILNLHVTIMRE
ncbi:MAG: DUF1553 domain-containing protein [Planctomycetes bacterium]|nr:DUF1553 domain-containing protein [Planctomycetota bacterium]